MPSSQPSFVVTRPGASSSRQNGGSSSAASTSASASHRGFKRAAAFGDDSDVEDDDDGGFVGRDRGSRHAFSQRTGLSSVSGKESRSNGKGKGRSEYLTDFVAGRQGESSSRDQQAKKQELVIPLQNNLDWRQNRKKMLGLPSPSYQAQLGSLTSMRTPGKDGLAPPPASAEALSNVERINDEEQIRGLVVKKREEVEMDLDVSIQEAPIPVEAPRIIVKKEDDTLSVDELARKALLDEMRNGDHQGVDVNPHSNLVIAMTEEDALRSDLDHRPDAPDAAAYEAVPVEAFGAAMLRGMGWKEGMGAGRRRNGPQQAPEVQRRAALLGLGAKERPPPENGAITAGSKTGESSKEAARSSRPNMKYVPVIQRERGNGKSGTPIPEQNQSERSGTNTPTRRDRDRERERERSPYSRDRIRDRDGRDHRSERDYREREQDRESKYSERTSRDEQSSRRHHDPSRESRDARDGRDGDRHRDRTRDDARTDRRDRDSERDRDREHRDSDRRRRER